MFNTDAKVITARVPHRCTNCGERIEPGQIYHRWVTFDDTATTSKMHPECLDDLQAGSEGSFEYMLYSGERPRVGA